MTENIFRFWAKIKRHEKIHPADRDVFDRVGRRGHGLDLRCLPGCFGGPLRNAPVVLLFLSPGFGPQDLKDARTSQGQARYAEQRKGYLKLRARTEHPDGHKWLVSKTKAFGIEFEKLRRKIAVLNIGAYHSKEFKDYPLLAALPSSRVSLEWAQNKLFPQAIRGERVVICLRAAHFWGLAEGKTYGRSLFAPSVTRGGHMRKKTRKQNKMRENICRAVQKAIVDKK
jgi:hypothetical protein